MDRDNRHIPRVIESADSRVRQRSRGRFDFSPRQALYYNDHPDAIIEDFQRSEYGAVLREIEGHLVEWEHARARQFSAENMDRDNRHIPRV